MALEYMQFFKWKIIMVLFTAKGLMYILLIVSKEQFNMISGFGVITTFVMNLNANKIIITFSQKFLKANIMSYPKSMQFKCLSTIKDFIQKNSIITAQPLISYMKLSDP